MEVFCCSTAGNALNKMYCRTCTLIKKKLKDPLKSPSTELFFLFLYELQCILKSTVEAEFIDSTRIFLCNPVNMESPGWFNDFLFRVWWNNIIQNFCLVNINGILGNMHEQSLSWDKGCQMSIFYQGQKRRSEDISETDLFFSSQGTHQYFFTWRMTFDFFFLIPSWTLYPRSLRK